MSEHPPLFKAQGFEVVTKIITCKRYINCKTHFGFQITSKMGQKRGLLFASNVFNPTRHNQFAILQLILWFRYRGQSSIPIKTLLDFTKY